MWKKWRNRMLTLSNLGPKKGAVKKRKRVGRGDTTAGRGTKGQKARSGGAKPPWFEGGQMPLYRRLPKRGFKNPFRIEYQIVNVDQLERVFKAGERVNVESLIEKGLVKKRNEPVKLLGRGEITKALEIEVDKASKSAIEKVEKAGGKVIIKAEEG
jgi:large subunit ribosomal protein L15